MPGRDASLNILSLACLPCNRHATRLCYPELAAGRWQRTQTSRQTQGSDQKRLPFSQLESAEVTDKYRGYAKPPA